MTSLHTNRSHEETFDQRPESAVGNELSLIDIWLVLARRKWIIAAVLGIALAAGLASALLTPRSYAYTTIIEIGTRGQDDTGRDILIELPETVRTKLAEVFIPQTLHEYYRNNPGSPGYEIKAEVPKNSQAVVLKSKDSADEAATYATLHEAVVRRLEQDHGRILGVLETNLEHQLQHRERRLAELRDQAKLLEALIDRLDAERELLVKEIDSLRSQIATAEKRRRQLIQGASTDDMRTMTLLLLTEEHRGNRAQLIELEKRAVIGVPNERDILLNQLADNRRAQLEEEEKMRAQTEARRLKFDIRATHAAVPPSRSLEPVGPSRTMIVVSSALAGLFVGIILALLVEFVAQARHESTRKLRVES